MTDTAFTPNATPGKGKGKHVTTACSTCRKKKIKCDANRPQCSNCILYGQECIFPSGPDKRKIPSKDRISALTSQCQILEGILKQSGIPFTPFNADGTPPNESPAARGLSTPEVPTSHDAEKAQAQSDASPGPVSIIDARRVQLKSGDIHGGGSVADASVDNEFSTASSEDEALVDQLTGRMGSLQIAEDGQKRFYGATSNLNILHNGPMSLTRPKYSSLLKEGQNLLESRALGQQIDTAFEDHLLRLYFCWEDPTIHVMDEAIFFRERKRCKQSNEYSPLYSETLVNAMCSIGATMNTQRRSDLPDPMDDFFTSRSKTLLEVELDSPSLSTVQSLVILSAIEAALTRDARGWMYSGMAVRLSSDLGLHLDVGPHVEAGLIDAEEAMIRNLIWWGVFTHDRMWSLYMGRPVAMDDKHITAQPPTITPRNSATSRIWQPYTGDHDSHDEVALEDPIEDISKQMANLCAKMTRIRETLYSDTYVASQYLPTLFEFAADMLTELAEWLSAMPSPLVPDYQETGSLHLPHVLQLHMQYQCILITLTRPFMSSTRHSSTLTMHQIKSMRGRCLDAARAMAQLLRIYRRNYTLRRMNVQAVHLVFTASLILACSACGAADPGEREESWPYFETTCQALREMGQAFRSSSRALEVITCIKAELLKQTRRNKKRPNQSVATDAQHTGRSRKRRSTAAEASMSTDPYSPVSFDQLEATPDSFDFESNDPFLVDDLLWNDYNTIELIQNAP